MNAGAIHLHCCRTLERRRYPCVFMFLRRGLANTRAFDLLHLETRSHKERKQMKTVTKFIYASVAVMILSACSQKMAVNTPSAKPTLTPQAGPITVMIETSTQGAYLSWTDDGSQPSPNNGKIIQSRKGPAPTVFGRTLRAIAFIPGTTNTNSPTAQGSYVGN